MVDAEVQQLSPSGPQTSALLTTHVLVHGQDTPEAAMAEFYQVSCTRVYNTGVRIKASHTRIYMQIHKCAEKERKRERERIINMCVFGLSFTFF